MRLIVLSAVVCLITANPTFAHSGHGPADGQSVWHYVASPWHAGPVVIACVAVAMMAMGTHQIHRRRRAQALLPSAGKRSTAQDSQ